VRAAVVLLISSLVSGCAVTQPRQWDKPGADREMARQDLRDCRRAATNAAWRSQHDYSIPRYTLPTGVYSNNPGRVDPYYVRREPERFTNEARLTSFCMRNRGYELNPVPTDIRPTSPPRSP
jgi:hypothetical protein